MSTRKSEEQAHERVAQAVETLQRKHREAGNSRVAVSEIKEIANEFSGIQEIHEEAILRLLQCDIENNQEHGISFLQSEYEAAFPTISADVIQSISLLPPPRKTRTPLVPRRYRILGSIGQGGVGVVWSAHDENLDRVVAIKTLRDHLQSDPVAIANLDREAKLAGALQHPTIPPVIEQGNLLTGSPYFAMKLVKGDSLGQLLDRREDLVSDRVKHLRILLQAAQGVAFAHSQGVVHCDLKPHNIMVGEFGEVQIMDWGLALVDKQHEEPERANNHGPSAPFTTTVRKELDTAAGESKQLVGSPSYMSPEQARGAHDEIDARTDVYALAGILHEVLTGQPPNAGSRFTEVVENARSKPIDTLSNHAAVIPYDLEKICTKGLSLIADDRYVSAQAFGEDLSRFLDGRPILARQTSVAKRAWMWSKRRPAVASLLVALFIALGVGLASAAWQWRQTDLARKASEEDLSAAMESVDRVLVHLASDALDDVPGAKQIRIDALNDALHVFRRLLKRRSDDERIALQIAKAESAVGQIYDELEKRDLAKKHLAAAVVQIEEIEAEFENREKWSTAAANIYLNYANHLDSRKQAHSLHLKRLQLLRGLESDSLETRRDRASALAAIASSRPNSEWEIAKEENLKAIADLELLVHENPDSKPTRRALARILLNYSKRLDSEGQRSEANQLRERAAEHHEYIIKSSPSDEYQRQLYASLCVFSANRLAEQGKLTESVSFSDRGLATLRSLVTDFPSTPRHRDQYASLLYAVGKRNGTHAELAIPKFEAAALQYETLIGLMPNDRNNYSFLANTLRELIDVLMSEKRKSEAEVHLRRRLEIREQVTTILPEGLINLGKTHVASSQLELAQLIKTSKSKSKKSEAAKLEQAAQQWLGELTPESVLASEKSRSSKRKLIAALLEVAEAVGDLEFQQRLLSAKVSLSRATLDDDVTAIDSAQTLAKDLYKLAISLVDEKPTEAIEHLRDALTHVEDMMIADPDADAHLMLYCQISERLTMTFVFRGMHSEALPLLQRELEVRELIISRSPNEWFPVVRKCITLNNLAIAMGGLKRWQEAREAIDEFHTLREPMIESVRFAHFASFIDINTADFLVQIEDVRFKDPDRAVKLARRACEMSAEKSHHWLIFGHTLVDVGNFEEAAKAFNKALELKTDRAGICHLQLARCHAEVGDFATSDTAWNSALQWQSNQSEPDEEFEQLRTTVKQARASLSEVADRP